MQRVTSSRWFLHFRSREDPSQFSQDNMHTRSTQQYFVTICIFLGLVLPANYELISKNEWRKQVSVTPQKYKTLQVQYTVDKTHYKTI